jgi:uncharacterized damage-inducible protein DinB
MNSIEQNYLPLFREYQAIREQIGDVLTDDDLRFSLGGETLTLGVLCREIGEVERAYIDSFKTFKLDFGYRHADASVETSVAALRAWWAALDAELVAVIAGLSDDDINGKTIDRGWPIPVQINLDIYKEGLIIFYGKASIYFRAMRKPRPKQMTDWIA